MQEPFDPYHKWLGIPPHEQPPNHYRLLGINLFESDPDVISAAADRQMGHIRTYQAGPRADESQRILNELAAARLCLLDAVSRAAYDFELREKLSSQSTAIPPENPFAECLRSAARYATLEFEHLWLSRISLPRAYLGLGRDMVRERRFPDEFSAQYARLDDIVRRHGSLRPKTRGGQTATGSFASTYWQMLDNASRTVRHWLGNAVYHYRHRAALRGLGRAAYAAHQNESGPRHLTGRIQDMKGRLEQLGVDLERLSTVPEGQYLSPQRAVWLLLGMMLLPILLLFWLL